MKVTADDELVLLNDEPRPWSDVDRWNYFEVPTPPDYTIYTVYTAAEYVLDPYFHLVCH